MRTTTHDNDTSKKREFNKVYGILAVCILTVLGLLYVGMQIEKARQPDLLPPNVQCVAALEKQPVFLQAQINKTFGVEIPEGTPTKEEVDKLSGDCLANVTKYEVVIESE